MLYIEDFNKEHAHNKDFSFLLDDRIPADLRVKVAYKEREMISLSVQDTTNDVLTDICFAIKKAYSEGELFGRFMEYAR